MIATVMRWVVACIVVVTLLPVSSFAMPMPRTYEEHFEAPQGSHWGDGGNEVATIECGRGRDGSCALTFRNGREFNLEEYTPTPILEPANMPVGSQLRILQGATDFQVDFRFDTDTHVPCLILFSGIAASFVNAACYDPTQGLIVWSESATVLGPSIFALAPVHLEPNTWYVLRLVTRGTLTFGMITTTNDVVLARTPILVGSDSPAITLLALSASCVTEGQFTGLVDFDNFLAYVPAPDESPYVVTPVGVV